MANVFVKLPLRNEAELQTLIAVQSDRRSPFYHHFLSRAQFAARYGPDAGALGRTVAALRARGLNVAHVGTQSVYATARADVMARAFGTTIAARRQVDGATRLVTTTAVRMPVELARERAVVVGLSARALGAKTLSRSLGQVPDNRYSSTGGYWFTDLKESYEAPSYLSASGKGATIGIVISSDVKDSDTAKFFNHERFSTVSGAPVPTVVRRYVDGAVPGLVTGDGGFEAALDVQQSLGSAPSASVLLYDIPDLSNQSTLDAYQSVVDDNKADVISSSFGECERFFLPDYNGGLDFSSQLIAQNQIFQQGNAQGQTFLASSGDSSGLACPSFSYFDGTASPATFEFGAETPASSANVTAVGGTNLVTLPPAGPRSGRPAPSIYVRESEFADTEIPYDPYGIGKNVSGGLWGSGSGESLVFKRTHAQRGIVKTKGRSVPDISLQMGGCPGGISLKCGADDSFSILAFFGNFYGVIGTSASSPEMAGLLAVEVGATGQRLGDANESLYEAERSDHKNGAIYRTGIPGFNGLVTEDATPRRYSAIVGLGTPHVAKLLGIDGPLAGDPATATNP